MSRKMSGETAKKCVKDMDGLLRELRDAPFVVQPQMVVGELAVIFLFGMIIKYLKLMDIGIGHLEDLDGKLDAITLLENDEELQIEFESCSKHFEKHVRKGDIEPEDYKDTLIVCWNDNWDERPSEIDVLPLEPSWKQAQQTTH